MNPRLDTPPPSHSTGDDAAIQDLLDYLHHHLPGYPFHPTLDALFVAELAADFPHVDLLEETKAFRWFYDNQPATQLTKVRVALRRWIANAWTRRR